METSSQFILEYFHMNNIFVQEKLHKQSLIFKYDSFLIHHISSDAEKLIILVEFHFQFSFSKSITLTSYTHHLLVAFIVTFQNKHKNVYMCVCMCVHIYTHTFCKEKNLHTFTFSLKHQHVGEKYVKNQNFAIFPNIYVSCLSPFRYINIIAHIELI